MADAVFIVVLLVATAASMLAAVNALRRHPRLWERAGYSQKLRLFIFLSPVATLFLLPLGIALTIYYFASVRPQLEAAAAGYRPAPRRAVGFTDTWRGLSWRQKVKAVLALGIAFALLVAVYGEDSAGSTMPLIAEILLAPIVLILFFLAIYIGLSLVQFLFPVLLGGKPGGLVNEGVAPNRTMERQETWEAQRRANSERRVATRQHELRMEEVRRAEQERRRRQGRRGW